MATRRPVSCRVAGRGIGQPAGPASAAASEQRRASVRIGFIGLGTMGAGMASNLQKAGYDLVVHDLSRQAASAHLAAGATWAASPAELAAQVEVVLTSLPGPREVEAVTTGAEGVLAGLRPGGVLFDLTTNAPAMVRKLAGVFAEKGCHFLDAPVSGGPAGARSGRMAIWVGGDAAAFERYESVLRAISDAPRRIGDIGAGSVAKLVHNCAGYAVQAALAEVFALGVKGGVEPLALWEAVRSGAIGRRRTLDGLIDQFLPGTYDPPAFALALAHKDVMLATELGRELGVPMRLANLALADMTEAMNRGWQGRDSRSPMLLQLERAGVEIAVDPRRLAEALDRDPPIKGVPERR
jgi:3-hydroxyisobutyrate dehydrogenase-like beta-hydroxyacid dehydrogenase